MTRTLAIAHRGFSARYPENTLTAYRAAVQTGADIVESDEQLPCSADMDHNSSCFASATHERVGYAEVPENLEASGVDHERARLVRAVDQTVNDARLNSERVERSGQHQTGRACSNHQNVRDCSFVQRHITIAFDRA